MIADLSGSPWRLISLSERRGIYTLVDAADYAWLVAEGYKWNISWGSRTPDQLYAKRNTGPSRATIRMHREIMLRAGGCCRCGGAARCVHVVDHINGQTLDNRKANLRWVTHAENAQNRRLRIPSIEEIVAGLLAAGASQAHVAELEDLGATF